MAITYSWKIIALKCYANKDGKNDVVFFINWRRFAQEDGYEFHVSGSVFVELDPTQPFTPYAELTQDQIISWVENAIDAEDLIEKDNILAGYIEDAKANPTVLPPLPWQN